MNCYRLKTLEMQIYVIAISLADAIEIGNRRLDQILNPASRHYNQIAEASLVASDVIVQGQEP